jgi:hypothetical protein
LLEARKTSLKYEWPCRALVDQRLVDAEPLALLLAGALDLVVVLGCELCPRLGDLLCVLDVLRQPLDRPLKAVELRFQQIALFLGRVVGKRLDPPGLLVELVDQAVALLTELIDVGGAHRPAPSTRLTRSRIRR